MMNGVVHTTFACCPRPGVIVAILASSFLLGESGFDACADEVFVDSHPKILREGTNAVLFWRLPAECGDWLYLESAPAPNGPWSRMSDPEEPLTVAAGQGADRFFRTELLMPTGAPGALQIAQSVRGFALSSNPDLNPATQFDIRIEPVRGLWEVMQIQAVDVRYLVNGEEFNRFSGVLYSGSVRALGQSFGGYGLMSGLVQGSSFYFTYSWGSGIHRSHVGKLQVVNGDLQVWDSGGFFDVDLFLSRRGNGQIAIVSGKFESFNQWMQSSEYAQVDETDVAATKLIGLDGTVLATLLPIGPGNVQPNSTTKETEPFRSSAM